MGLHPRDIETLMIDLQVGIASLRIIPTDGK